MTFSILTCSNTSFIVKATKYLLRMSLKSLQSMRINFKLVLQYYYSIGNLGILCIWSFSGEAFPRDDAQGYVSARNRSTRNRSTRKRILVHHRAETLRAEKIGVRYQTPARLSCTYFVQSVFDRDWHVRSVIQFSAHNRYVSTVQTGILCIWG